MTTTVLGLDGFDLYTTSAHLAEMVGAVVGTPTPYADGRGGVGQCCRITANAHLVKHVLGAGHKTICQGAGFKAVDYGGTTAEIFGFEGVDVHLRADAAGHLWLYYSNTIITTVSMPPTGQWHYFELKVFSHASTGTVEVWVDGNKVINLTGQAFAGAPDITAAYFGGYVPAAVDHRWDDWYRADDRIGDVACRWLPVSAAGNYQEWTPLSSTNKSNVDDTDPDDDTTYNHDGTSGHRDTYTLDGSNLPSSGTVVAVKSVFWARKDDVGDRLLVPTMRQATHDHDGTGDYLGLSYTYHKEISQTNPETSAAYTLSELTGSEFGYKVG